MWQRKKNVTKDKRWGGWKKRKSGDWDRPEARKEERWKYREKLTTWKYQLMTCRYEKTARWREGRGENFSVIYLILLSHFSFPIASLLHFACQPRSLKYIYLCQSKLNFHLSLHCLTPLFPPPCIHSSSCLSLLSPSVSPIKTRYYTHTPNGGYSPPAPEEKV